MENLTGCYILSHRWLPWPLCHQTPRPYTLFSLFWEEQNPLELEWKGRWGGGGVRSPGCSLLGSIMLSRRRLAPSVVRMVATSLLKVWSTGTLKQRSSPTQGWGWLLPVGQGFPRQEKCKVQIGKYSRWRWWDEEQIKRSRGPPSLSSLLEY